LQSGRDPKKKRAAGREAVPGCADLPHVIGSNLRGVLRLGVYFVLTLLLMPVQLLFLLMAPSLAERLPLFYHRRCAAIMGFRIAVRGVRSSRRPTLFVSNHTSYLDIMILGALIPGCFVAKSEVARWPFFGWLAKLQRTVFVDRRRTRAADQRDALQQRIDAAENLILFPEGTSNDGNRVLPFRSALLAVAERKTASGGPLLLQPVSIAYVTLDGMPLGHGFRPLVAWYGDMTLFKHLWHFSRLGRTGVVVEFHPLVSAADFPSRKALSAHCAAAVVGGVGRALAFTPSFVPKGS